MNTTTATVWEASQPVSRLQVWADALKALEYHYRRLATTVWKAHR